MVTALSALDEVLLPSGSGIADSPPITFSFPPSIDCPLRNARIEETGTIAQWVERAFALNVASPGYIICIPYGS